MGQVIQFKPKVRATPAQQNNIADRLERIKASIGRINEIMADLRRNSDTDSVR